VDPRAPYSEALRSSEAATIDAIETSAAYTACEQGLPFAHGEYAPGERVPLPPGTRSQDGRPPPTPDGAAGAGDASGAPPPVYETVADLCEDVQRSAPLAWASRQPAASERAGLGSDEVMLLFSAAAQDALPSATAALGDGSALGLQLAVVARRVEVDLTAHGRTVDCRGFLDRLERVNWAALNRLKPASASDLEAQLRRDEDAQPHLTDAGREALAQERGAEAPQTAVGWVVTHRQYLAAGWRPCTAAPAPSTSAQS
jgi:hypothetical protein